VVIAYIVGQLALRSYDAEAQMFHVFRDDAHRRITVRLTGVIGFADAAQFIDQQLAGGAWSYAVLYDATASTGIMAAGDVAPLAEHVELLNRPTSGRGPIAVVTKNPDVYAWATAYQTHMETSGVAMAVFAEMDAAERWLDAQRRRNN
jgi:hypothetical protein